MTPKVTGRVKASKLEGWGVAERQRKLRRTASEKCGLHKEEGALSISAVSCSWSCWASSPCLIAGLWVAAARGVGLHRRSYICLSVITNQDEGYMGNYHWQLIPQAYRGILNTSQWSTCLREASHPAEPLTCTCHTPHVRPLASLLT